MNKLFVIAAAALMAAGTASAGEKKLMHCFAFTSIEGASKADWDAFFKATDELPKKIKGVSHVWYGKLANPLKANDQKRDYGVCMEMAGPDARKAYGNDPAHEAWNAAYEKVRVEGTTSIDILGQ